MLYNHHCPYCDSTVKEIEYTSESGVQQWAFYCECGHGALRYNEEQAYENYLHERENLQLTNFDKYFSDLGTEDDLDTRLNQDCDKYKGQCEFCPWGKFDLLFTNEFGDEFGCFEFWNWLGKGIYHD